MKISKGLLSIAIVLASVTQSFAHYMWLETAEKGELGGQHSVKVKFGEYTYGVIEDPSGENFENVKNFKLWVITPSGKKVEISTKASGDGFEGRFTPQENGTYTVTLNNDEIDVIDYTQYDFGIFKTHYHSTAKVVVGNEINASSSTNERGLVVVNESISKASKGSEVVLKVLYKGQPAAEQEVVVYISDQWSKKLYADENGVVKFSLPWDAKYTIETTRKEEVPGSYKGEDYQFIWHCATYCIAL